MRSILFVALLALIAVAPAKADGDGVDKEGSSQSCEDVANYNIFLAIYVDPSKFESQDDVVKVKDTLNMNLAVFAGLDSSNCVATWGLGDYEVVEVYVKSLNPEKTISILNENFALLAAGALHLEDHFDWPFTRVVLAEAAATVATVDKETTQTTTRPIPEVLDVLESIVVDLKTNFSLQDDTIDLIDVLCQADSEKCATVLKFFAQFTGDFFNSQAKNKEEASTSDSASPGVSVGTVVGISIGCVAGTLLIALIAVKAKTGSAIPRRGRVSLSPSSSSSAALLGQRIDVRSAWAEAEI